MTLVGLSQQDLEERAERVRRERVEAVQRIRQKLDPETLGLFDAFKSRFGARFTYIEAGGESIGQKPEEGLFREPSNCGTPGLCHNYHPMVVAVATSKYLGRRKKK